LGAFGYNRDGKSGKMQIVIGLLCDQAGIPLLSRATAFRGNGAGSASHYFVGVGTWGTG